MKQRMLMCMMCVMCVCLLTGCASLLEREYHTVEPHSSKFWESEAAGTLRAENYQDVVNDLLLLIGEHRETATLRLYDYSGELKAKEDLDRAAMEVQQETPLGAYAVQYFTIYVEEQKGYYEAEIQIGYRRTLEQIQSVVSATTPEALYSLLEATITQGRAELAVQIGYWGADGQSRVQAAIDQLRTDLELTEEPQWSVNYYPETGDVGLVEVLLDVPPEEELPEEQPLPEGDTEEQPEEAESGEQTAEGETADTVPEEPQEKSEKENSKN